MKQEIKSKQVELLYSHLPVSILTGYIAFFFISAVVWNEVDPSKYAIWIVAFNLIMIYRAAILSLYKRKDKIGLHLRTWDQLNLFSTLATGLIWGALTVYFSPAWPVELQVSMWVLLIALMSGASASFSVNYSYYLAYVIPIFLLAEYAQYAAGSYYMMALYFFYMLLLSVTARNFNKAQNTVIAQQLGLIEANIQLETLASNDALTKVPNRRAFDENYTREWSRHVRSKLPLSILMIDVDHFKKYNDHYGHEKGDRCLVDIAQAIQQSLLRPSDMVARYGGEEFVVLLSETESKGAMEVADRIHDNVRTCGIDHRASTSGERLTVSIGIATTTPEARDDPKVLLLLADRELYKAKANGRNRTSMSDIQWLSPNASRLDG